MTSTATAGRRFRIVPDTDPQNPRDDDNLGVIVVGHNRYVNGDKSVSDVRAEVRAHRPFLVLVIHAYIHSGIRLWTEEANGPCVPGSHRGWDTGDIGVIYATFDACRKEFGRNFTKAQVAARLSAEVDAYSKYCNGEAYGYQLLVPVHSSCALCSLGEGDDRRQCDSCAEREDYNVEDSCYGFNSIEDARAEAKAAGGTEEVDE